MRLFIAIRLPNHIIDDIGKLIERISSAGCEASFVKPTNLHITLKFLGEVREGDVKDITGIIEKRASSISPFRIGLSSIGAFPTKRKPRVIWIGIDKGREDYVKLASSMNSSLNHVNMESRKPRPHITIARVKHYHDASKIASVIDRIGDVKFDSFDVSSIYLMESKLSSRGVVYNELKKFSLAKA